MPNPWDKEALKELIFLYKQQPALYNSGNKFYHFKSRRNEALELITRALNKNCDTSFDVEDIEQKIKFLRHKYFAEVNKAKKKGNFRSSLWFYDDLKFLSEVAGDGDSTSADKNSSVEHVIPITLLNDVSPVNINDTSTPDMRLRRSIKITSTPDAPIARKKRKLSDTLELLDDPMDSEQSTSVFTSPPEDALDNFAKMIVSELCVIKNKTILRRAKRRIVDYIYQAQEEDEMNHK